MTSLKHSFIFILVSHIPTVLSIPFNQTETYVPNPTGRGTIGLLWSCTVTFGLCVWTAIHPNIVPIMDRGYCWSRTYYKLTWLFIAAVLPEFIVCCAASQLWRARQVHRLWQESWKDVPGMEQWLGMSGAFFVVMGGYVVEVKSAPNETSTPIASNSKTEIIERDELDLVTTISPTGFEELLRRRDFEKLIISGRLTEAHFSHHNIEDKGKASSIAKLLVTLQILWMVVQCVGRKAAGLPVTPLELHVLIQICYAVVIYCCWWNKPLDVSEPICLPLDATIFSNLNYNIKEETRAYSRDPLFITERRKRGGFIRTGSLAVYEIGVHMRDKTELWSAIMALISGGLHATAWNWHFPTSGELWLWRLACLGLGVAPLLLYLIVRGRGLELYVIRALVNVRFTDRYFIIAAFKEFFRWIRDTTKGNPLDGDQEKPQPKGWPEWCPIWLRSLLCLVLHFMALGYAGSILYLTAESFLSLREMPGDAYSTVAWSSFSPHL